MSFRGVAFAVALAGLAAGAAGVAVEAAPLSPVAPSLPAMSVVEVHHPGFAHCHIKKVRHCKIKSNGKKTCTKWKVVSKRCHSH